jgi:putative flippase GtrA
MYHRLENYLQRLVGSAGVQVVKFMIVGITNTAVDLAILNALIALSGDYSGLRFPVFKIVSYACASLNSYLLNGYWTFRSGGLKRPIVASRFAVATLVGFAINVFSASMVVQMKCPSIVPAQLWPSVAGLFGVLAGVTSNFLSYKFAVFRTQEG